MGLPQESPSMSAEVTTTLSTYVSIPPRFGGISSCDLDGLHGGSVEDMEAEHFPCSSTSHFQRKTCLEAPRGTDGWTKCTSAIDGAVNLHGLNIESKDEQGWLYPKVRVVGFESSQLGSSAGGCGKIVDGNHSSPADLIADNSIDPNGSQVRKRLHSPLNGMVCKQFHRDMSDLSGCESRRDLYDPNRKYNIHALHDRKKANIGSTDIPEAPIWSISGCANGFTSGFFTDGPLLENAEPFPHIFQSSPVGFDPDNSSMKTRTFSAAINISPKKVHSPSLSLSPLGPKWADRMKTKGICRDISREIESDFSIFKNFKDAVGENSIGIQIHSEGEGFRERNAFENTDILHNESEDLFTPLISESAPAPRSIKFAKNLNLIPVRRSLVGSFEESLLSGRFSSGNVCQRIDGFLAVLNVTGGSFSPSSQKLPFCVTSIDGDSSLLYYASIDLAGSLPSSKGIGPKLKRSLSNEDSRAAKSRLRIPMKGRIQLVLSNPEKTPVHTFFCNYDLSDMPAGTKTFTRQKVTLACPASSDQAKEETKAQSAKIRPSTTLGSERSEHLKRAGCVHTGDLPSKAQSIKEINSGFSSTDVCLETPNGFNYGVHGKDNTGLNREHCQKSDKDVYSRLDTLHTTSTKSTYGSPKSNSGALRYALHLRFLCPSSRKCLKSMQRCVSDPFLVPQRSDLDIEGERRFYLYNDLRVVFPQRHSDADEGKLNVEHHFPADPKYFNISN